MSLAPPPTLFERWLHANRSTIAAKHSPHVRAAENARLAATLRRITSERTRITGVSASAISASVRVELARPGRYHLKLAVVEPRATWWEILGGWIAGRVGALYRLLAAHVKVGPKIRTTVGDIVILLTVLFVALVGARMLRSLQIVRDAVHAVQQPLAFRQSAQALFAAADAHAQAGDHARAIRELFIAAITLLDVRGVLHAESSATVNELRSALLVANDRVEPAFIALTENFSAVTYAEQTPSAREWQAARAAYLGIVSAITTT